MTQTHKELGLPGPLPDGVLRVVPLGGLGEIGRNMTVLEFGGRLLIIDCGVLFPEDHQPGVDLIPMTDDRVETHIVIDDADEPSGRRAVHFQEYWVRLHAEVPARAVVPVVIDASTPGPGVLAAIDAAARRG